MAQSKPLVHCLMDVEPASFHVSVATVPVCFAINLSLECPSDSGAAPPVGDEEDKARLAFETFLREVQKVEFHVWELVGGRTFKHVGKVADQVSEATFGVAMDLFDWLDQEKPPASTPAARYWSTAVAARATEETEVTVEAAGASHRLRAAQSWNAPIAHKFALTHVLRPETSTLDYYVVLPYFADPGATPDPPVSTGTDKQETWDISYNALGAVGEITCRTDLLGIKKSTAPLDLPGKVDTILTPEGFLKVAPDAANLRRVSRWLEDRAASLMAIGPALASRPLASTDYDALFEPAFPDNSTTKKPEINAPVAAWAAAAGLCAALDNLVIGILKPASGNAAEGEILAPLVSALLAQLDTPEIRGKFELEPRDLQASIMAGVLREVIRQSPLAQRVADRKLLADALCHVHGIGTPAPDAAVETKYLEALLRFYRGNPDLTVDRTLPPAVTGSGLVVLMRALGDVERRLQDEAGAEAAVLRLIETSAAGFNWPPSKLIAEKYLAAISKTGMTLQAAIEQQVVPQAWAAYRAVLEGAFNGAEAVRRATGSEFLKAALAQVGATTDTSARVRALVKGADYFVKRLFGPTASPAGCFDDLAKVLPAPDFLGSDKTLIVNHLTAGYAAAVEPLDTLFDAAARFIPDNSPHPLSIQIAANIDGAKVDNFARYLNGIAVGLRRIDSSTDSENLWAHANLADLTWTPPEKKDLDRDKSIAGAIHPMLPAVSDGRAPMFVDYEGFPFASTELLQTRLPDSAAVGTREFRQFYRHTSSQASGFARVPRLAYGRTFESFSFVTSNAGTLPIAQQSGPTRPWMPRETLTPPDEARPGDLIATTEYSRRTAISQSAVSETRGRTARIGAPIAGVAPLASDYPRIDLFDAGPTDGVRDLFRESNGRGALVIGSSTVATTTNTCQLADIRWTGQPKLFTLQFFEGPAAGPGQPGAADVTFEQTNATNAGNPSAVDLAQVDAIGIAIKATRNGSGLDVELEVGCAGSTLRRAFKTRFDTLWLRLMLRAEGPSASMTFADVGANKPDGVDAPLLLLAPSGEAWNAGLSADIVTTVHSPRIGYLDFERWFANSDLRKRAFKENEDAAKLLEAALLAAYVMRHLDEPLAAALDRLPDPAVEHLHLELVVLDQLAGVPAAPSSATFNLAPLLLGIAENLEKEAKKKKIDWTPTRLRDLIFKPIADQFCCTITIGSGDATAKLEKKKDNAFTATVPAGHVAHLSIDALVPAEHFDKQGSHPTVFDRGLLQYATRNVAGAHVAFPSAALRVETMLAFTKDQKKGAVQLAADMIVAQPVERSRRFDIVAQLPEAGLNEDETQFWRLIGEVDVTSQRWRPSGRPIYHHVAPKDYRADGKTGASVDPALPLRLDNDGCLTRFEDEAFFDRPNLDAQTITQKLLPLPSRTVLQQHFWDAPSATYFRHRFTLRSRYAGALCVDRELNAWSADRNRPVTAWTMRVAMCGTVTAAIPQTYRKAYFDLIATDFKPQSGGGALRLLLRLIGSAAHLRQFKSLVIGLTNLDNPAGAIEVPLDNGAEDFTKAVELKVEAAGGLSAALLRSDGRAAPVANKKPFTIKVPSNANPGFFMTIKAQGGTGELWADVSLLHSPENGFPTYFDFTWLFGSPDDVDPATAVAPQNLRAMAEAQARVVAVSPPIPIVSHNEPPGK